MAHVCILRKENIMKKIVVVFLAITLLASCFSGCAAWDKFVPGGRSDRDSKSTRSVTIEEKVIPSPPPLGERALVPDFVIQDESGNEVMLSSYRGKVVVMNFWASWCEACVNELPELQKLNDELKDSDEAVLLMINMADGTKETIDSALKYMNDNGYAFNNLFDTTGDLAQLYEISKIPITIVIDKNGYFVGLNEGPTTKDDIEFAIEQAKKVS